jgi:hypothetical protein
MIQNRYKLINWLAFALLFALCCGFQTSFWYQITGSNIAPQFWLIIFLYLALNRTYLAALISSYGLAMVMKGFSAIPLGILLLTIFISISLAHFVKTRMFWPTIRYFLMATLAFSVTFNLSYYFISQVIEANPARLLFWTRFFDTTLTIFFAWPFYFVLQMLDKWTMPVLIDTKDFHHE